MKGLPATISPLAKRSDVIWNAIPIYKQCLHISLKYLCHITERRREFERRRKAHYREFEAVKLARKLIQEEDDDDDEDNDVASGSIEASSSTSYASCSNQKPSPKATTSASTNASNISTNNMELEPSHN